MAWWILTYWYNHPYPTSMHHWARTNFPDHLFMKWSTVRPTRSRILKNIRGKWVHCGYRYYWNTPNVAEQTQYGDTIEHHFYLQDLTPGSTIWFYLGAPGGPYGLEVQGPLSHVTLPLTTDWEPRLLVGTKTKGIYATQDFTGPDGDHPTWATHNHGLATLNICQLHGDLSNPDQRQYAIITANGSRLLYRREPHLTDAWTPILTDAQAATLTGASTASIHWVTTNSNHTGYVYALCSAGSPSNSAWLLLSPDSGDAWQAILINAVPFPLIPGNISCGAAQGDSPYDPGHVLYAAIWNDEDCNTRMYFSLNHGASWSYEFHTGPMTTPARVLADPSNQRYSFIGGRGDGPGRRSLYYSNNHGDSGNLIPGVADNGLFFDPHYTKLWIDPDNHDSQKILSHNEMWHATGSFLNWSSLGPTMVPVARLTILDLQPAFLYLGRAESAPLPPDMGWPHVLFASDDNGATMIGKSGAHAQYSDGDGDSIPYDCGGIAFDGILPLHSP